LSTIFESREKAYNNFLATATFLNDFLYVDLNTYEKFNFKGLGYNDKKHKKPKLIPDLRIGKDDEMESNLRVSLYS